MSHFEKRRPMYIRLLFVLAFLGPLLYVFTNLEWLYDPIVSHDSFIDYGVSLFYDVGYLLANYYRASRVPWLALTAYLQKLVGPMLLSPAVALLSWVAVTAIYLTVIQKLFGPRRRFLILPWLIFFPFLMGAAAGGVFYQNVTAICYFMLALLFWSRRVETQSSWWTLLLSGFFLGSALSTNVVHLNLLLLFPVVDLEFKKSFHWRNYFKLGLGFVLALVFWGLMNLIHGRPFFYYMAMLEAVDRFVIHPENQAHWHVTLKEILLMGKSMTQHLIFFAAAFLVALIQVFRSYLNQSIRSVNWWTWHYLLLCCVWMFWQAIGQTALLPTDFVYPLQLPMWLMLASWLKEGEITNRDFWSVAVALPFLWIALWSSEYLQEVPWFLNSLSSIQLSLFATAVLFNLFFFKKYFATTVVGCACLGLLYSLLATEPRSNMYPDCHHRQESYQAIMNVASHLQKLGVHPGQVLVYGDLSRGGIEIPFCPSSYRLSQNEYPVLISLWFGRMIGSFDYQKRQFSRSVDQLKIEDFKAIRDAKFVLFGEEIDDMTQRFLKRAETLGLPLQFVGVFEETVMGRKIKYAILEYKSEAKAPEG